MIKQKKQKYIFLVGLVGLLVAALTLANPLAWRSRAAVYNISSENIVDFVDNSAQNSKVVYLSDMQEMPNSRVGWRTLQKDQHFEGQPLTLRYENAIITFKKGLLAHAQSELYYDLRNYHDFDYFTAYLGINSTASSAGNVKFRVYTSVDGQNWGEPRTEVSDREMTSSAMAQFVKIDIRNVNYLKLVADKNGSNSNDHAVYGDAKLVKSDYHQYDIPTVSEIDADFVAAYPLGSTQIDTNPDYEIAILRREFLKNVGQYSFTTFLRESEANREMMNWFYNDLGALRLYIAGGKPSGSYLNSLTVLSRLYNTYKDDLSDNNALTAANGRRGDLYKKMMITLSLTHGQEVRFWIRDQGEMANNPASPNISDPVKRYAVIKRMYLSGKLVNRIFETLEVEEMRYVMFTELGDDEMEWVNDWAPTIGNGLYHYPPVPYISIGNHYWYEQNYDPNYVDTDGKTWAEKYKLITDNYTIGFEARAPHLWMITRYGGVCWQISNFGQNVTASYGVPSTTLGQPGHLAYANYEVNNAGIPAWALTNDVSGWAKTTYTGYTNTHTYHQVRQLNNWGSISGEYKLLNGLRYDSPGTYMLMSQAALNDYENYEKSQTLVKLADVYADDLSKQEQIYNQALTTQDINFDAWYQLIENYIKQGKPAADFHALAVRIAESLKRYPVPMHDLLRLIIAQIPVDDANTVGYNIATEMALTRSLEWTSKATDAEINTPNYRQGNVSRMMANYLLGRLNNEVATFSFDGDEQTAGFIKLGQKYIASSAAWQYSLDGGATWSNFITDAKFKQLTADEIAEINVDNDIKIHVQGVDYSLANIYTIDITKAELPSTLYANDLENRVVGVNLTMEWRDVTKVEGQENQYGEWTSYRDSSPQRLGDVTIEVRVGATGTKLPSDPREYSFTADTNKDERFTYLPVSHLSMQAVSSQATGGGQYGNGFYALDGNINTRWHSAWNGSDKEKWIVVKFDHKVDLSAFEYLPAAGGNGKISQVQFYVSDQEEYNPDTFKLAGEVSSKCGESSVICDSPWMYNEEKKTFNFLREEAGEVVSRAVSAWYLKIKATVTQSAGGGSFVAARMFNFFEDRTGKVAPMGSVSYSTIESTNGDVIARLVNLDRDVDVISETNTNDPYTYIFSENGEFTFEFKDKETGERGQAIAKVNWIHKSIPDPQIEFFCAKDGDIEDNGTEPDCSGQDKNIKVNRSVSARLIFPEGSQIKILNNGYQENGDGGHESTPDDEETDSDDTQISGDQNSLDPFTYLFMRNGSFTFRYEDAAGNTGTKTVWVDWIDKAAPKVVINYSTTDPTTDMVTAQLVAVPYDGIDEDDSNDVDMNGDFAVIDHNKYDYNGLQYDEEPIVINNDGSSSYTFKRNGEFTFKYRDVAGNTNEVLARVDWIQERPDDPEVPDDSNGDNPGVSDGANDDQTSGDPQPGINDDQQVNKPQGSQGAAGGIGNTNSGIQSITTTGTQEKAEAKSNRLDLPEHLKLRYGEDSEYYELTFVDENGNKLEVLPEQATITLPVGKTLKRIYYVKDDGSLELVEFERVDDRQIVIKNPQHGNYLFDYEENSEQNDYPVVEPGITEREEDQPKPWYQNRDLWMWSGIAVTAVVVVGLGVSLVMNRWR